MPSESGETKVVGLVGCRSCGALATRTCTICNNVGYCSEGCQAADVKRHAPQCEKQEGKSLEASSPLTDLPKTHPEKWRRYRNLMVAATLVKVKITGIVMFDLRTPDLKHGETGSAFKIKLPGEIKMNLDSKTYKYALENYAREGFPLFLIIRPDDSVYAVNAKMVFNPAHYFRPPTMEEIRRGIAIEKTL